MRENVFGFFVAKEMESCVLLFPWIKTIGSNAVLQAAVLKLSGSSGDFSLNMADSWQMFDAMPIWDEPPN